MRAARYLISAQLAAATLGCLPCVLPAQVGQPAADSSADAAQRDLLQQKRVLADRQVSQADRDKAALRLVSRSSPEADRILVDVLSDFANREGQLAVARALVTDTTPNPEFIDPLANLLGSKGAERNLLDAAAQALAAFKARDAAGNRAMGRLASFAVARNQPVAVRIAAVRAMGRLVDKRIAATLISLADDPTENPLVLDAVTEALTEMTGEPLGQNLDRWRRWWRDTRDSDEAAWSAGLLQRKAARVSEAEKRLRDLRDAVARIIREDYRKAAEADKPKLLNTFLLSESEDLRLVAVRQVWEEIALGKAVAPEVIASLRKLVGDSAAEVRREVARTLGAANVTDAVDGLLAQLAQENDPDVRAAIVLALGQVHDVRAVSILLERLNDDLAVAKAAADAMRELASTLNEPKNASLAAEVAQRLMQRLPGTEDPSALRLREGIVEALGAIGHPSSRGVLLVLLDAGREPSPRVRRAALRGLGRIGDPDTADMIIMRSLNDPDREVRAQAADALARTASFMHAEALRQRLMGGGEPENEVRDRIWSVLLVLFEKASAAELTRWPIKFQGEDEQMLSRRLAIYEILEKKLAADEPAGSERLASVRQSLGELRLKLGRADEAAASFRAALDFWTERQAPESVILPLMNDLMRSLLRAGKFADAIEFANGAIIRNRVYISDMWLQVQRELDRLRDAGSLDLAMQLVEQARKIAWTDLYASKLRQLEEDIRARQKSGGRAWVHQYNRTEHVAAVRQPSA